MLSKFDDYPIHQISDLMRFTASSNRNFYDRYYFNLHNGSDELFVIFGLGQYPNLSTQDAFMTIRYGTRHYVLRASRELGDRADISVGPFRIEVLEGLQRLRVVADDPERGIYFDAVFNGLHFPHLEPRHFIRKFGRVMFDTMRFAQLGYWEGELRIDDKHWTFKNKEWIGSRDRSWGIRPVGEEEPRGINKEARSMEGMWNYFPIHFDDFAILYILNEDNDGSRSNEEAMRIWYDGRESEWLGKPVHEHEFTQAFPYLANMEKGVVRFMSESGVEQSRMEVVPQLHTYLTAGTGYGLEPDWRHGMYQGDLVVQHVDWDVVKDSDKMLGLVESPAKVVFTDSDGKQHHGIGMAEYGFFTQFDHYMS